MEVGAGVTSVKPGDHVIPLYTPECRAVQVLQVRQDQPVPGDPRDAGQGPDARRHLALLVQRQAAAPLHGHEHVLRIHGACRRSRSPKIDQAAPLEKVCLLGCGITTGIGAVLNTAKVTPGATVAVFGLGGIGLAVIQGAVMAKAGAHHRHRHQPGEVRARAADGRDRLRQPEGHASTPIQQVIVEMTDGGVDYQLRVHRQRRGHARGAGVLPQGLGRVRSIIGVAGAGQEIRTRPFQLVTGRVWRGIGVRRRQGPHAAAGHGRSRRCAARSSSIRTSRTSCRSSSINEAFDLMHEGKSIRTVIRF